VSLREVKVYRLFIAYPESSVIVGADNVRRFVDGWTPPCWEDLLAGIADKRQRRAARERGFRWPRERLFLSSSSAYRRAGLLTWFGAMVEVEASEPVTWWQDVDSMTWYAPGDGEQLAPEPGAGAMGGADVSAVVIDEAATFAESRGPVTAADIDAVLREFEESRLCSAGRSRRGPCPAIRTPTGGSRRNCSAS
jgi:hypothetical protein